MSVRCTFRRMICGVIAIACVMLLGYGIMAGIRHDRTMHAALKQLQADNQADTIFTSDSAARALVRYFDHPWHNANDRLLAYYLLGRAHADMGEAPQAIEDYQTAIERADTAADCDFRLLRNVFGQMSEVFDAQNLPEDEMKADSLFIFYSWRIGDTIQAIDGYRSLERCYDLLGKPDSVLKIDSMARIRFLEIGDTVHAAATLIAPSYYHIVNQEHERARREIEIVRTLSNIFDGEGNLKSGYELYYYTIGLYFDGTNQLDSAEYYYRRALSAGELEAGYKGLLSLYGKLRNTDSIVKYAPLYADANDASHDSLRTAEVHKAASLYNYNRHLRTAQEAQTKAQRRLTVINGCFAIILLLVSIGYYSYSKMLKKERKREHALNIIQQNYIAVSNAYRELEDKYWLHQVQSEQIQQELQELSEQKEQLNILTKSLQEKNREGYYYSHDLVRQITDAAIGRTATPSTKQLEHLFRLFTDTFPHFIDFVDKTHSLTDYEWYVCIFTDLGLGNNDMAFLIGQTAQRVNNIKRQVNHNLFGEDSSSTLQRNLRRSVHTV